MQSQHELLFYDFMNTFKIQIALEEIFQCQMSITGNTGMNVARHELDIYCGERDPEETLQNVRNWSIMMDFQSSKYCIVAKIQ